MDWINLLKYLVLILFVFPLLTSFLKTRFKKFTPAEYVLFFRNGKLRSSGCGGAYFLLPFIDELITLPRAEQNLDLIFKQVSLKQDQFTSIHIDVNWSIDDPKKVFVSYFQQNSSLIEKVNRTISGILDNEIRQKFDSLHLKQALHDKTSFSQIFKSQLSQYFEPKGVSINIVQIQKIDLEKRI